ncbi:hypothetical protein SASPL_126904 [Salvia splendens]|uniref:RWD domain-containing protein n=1 Tax=Salvia splendens TaxID=180675 RepID=A0A8X8XHT8_SALSN|nr:hypothetical protein SASPL_126904 [Salvia splendens]
MKCFQAHIHVEVPKDLRVTAKFNSSASHQNGDGNSSDFSYSFQWLGSAKISDLCSKLDSIWLEQAGQEVIYQWLEWLHGCTLSYLVFDSDIILGPYGVKNNGDRRAISGSVSPDVEELQ